MQEINRQILVLQAFPRLVDAFRQFVLTSRSEDLENSLSSLARAKRERLLFRLFAEYAVDCHSEELQKYRCFTPRAMAWHLRIA